jgi:hypothetical protein
MSWKFKGGRDMCEKLKKTLDVNLKNIASPWAPEVNFYESQGAH